jgi:hypothetical protein
VFPSHFISSSPSQSFSSLVFRSHRLILQLGIMLSSITTILALAACAKAAPAAPAAPSLASRSSTITFLELDTNIAQMLRVLPSSVCLLCTMATLLAMELQPF